MNKGAWQATAHDIAKNQTQLSNEHTHTYLYSLVVKNLPAKQVIQVQFLSWEDSLEEEMATHFSIVAWEIPWIEEPAWLQSKELWKSQKPLNDWITQPQPLLGALSLHMDQLLFHSIES